MKEKIWQSILGLKSWVQNYPERVDQIFLIEEAGNWLWKSVLSAEDTPLLRVYVKEEQRDENAKGASLVYSSLFSFEIRNKGDWATDEIKLFADYLGYALLHQEAKERKRAITISHFAQTLDGQIATVSGDSKWIGNPENLIHAHRMRALCDGILIGSGTLICDKPALTVRHVAGNNPQRIILGSAQKGDFESLKQSDSSEIWSIGSNDLSQEEGVSSYILTSADANPYTCKQLLEWLCEKGIYSVYVEGGAKTTSCFLGEGMIDIMQLHLSPLVFGSGIKAIQLPQIQTVSESIKFDSFSFQPVGDSVMFVGIPIYNSGT